MIEVNPEMTYSFYADVTLLGRAGRRAAKIYNGRGKERVYFDCYAGASGDMIIGALIARRDANVIRSNCRR